MRLFHVLIAATVAALSGCGATTAPVVVREPVVVERIVYVPIDPGLTATKPIPEPRTDTGAEVLRVARERKTDLEACYADKREIGSVQGTAKPC